VHQLAEPQEPVRPTMLQPTRRSHAITAWGDGVSNGLPALRERWTILAKQSRGGSKRGSLLPTRNIGLSESSGSRPAFKPRPRMLRATRALGSLSGSAVRPSTKPGAKTLQKRLSLQSRAACRGKYVTGDGSNLGTALGGFRLACGSRAEIKTTHSHSLAGFGVFH